MMKVLLNSSRRFLATPSSLVRYMCTAVNVEYDAAAPETVQKVVRVKRDVLYRKLSVPGSRKGSTLATLNGFFSEKDDFKSKFELDSCILQLRRNGKVCQALEVMEWMQTRNIKFEPADHARQLDLISQVKGISAAENYFNGLPELVKDISTYGSLLNCYCKGKLTDKALDLFEKMDNMQFLSSVAFNNLMSLYMRLNMPEKVPALVQEMKNRNIPLSILTYNIWITSYTRLKDTEAAEKVFEEIRHNKGEVQYDWTTFSNLAVAYVKAGLYEKAESILKKLEEEIGKMGKRCGREPFHYLLSLYAGTSNLVEVHKIWKHLKSTFKITANKSTIAMLEALARLDDVNGFRKIFDEWESTCFTYDKRLPYHAIGFYLKHGMFKEAEVVFHNVLKRYDGNTHWFWKQIMPYYMEKHQLDFALRCLETAISVVKNNELHPTPEDVNRFMEYFKKASDVNNAEKFCKILKKVDLLDSKAYKLLLETYVAASKEAPDMRNRIMDDGIEVSPELEELLGRVMEWMQTRNIKFQPTDHAKFLDLVSKVKGISAAENYFSGLPESAKDKSTYGALLHCYCREKLADKAQTLFEKMDKMHIVSSLAFNNLMSLYMRRHMPEAVIPLVQEMKNRNFPLGVHTYNIWMTSYSQMNDIEGVERVFEEMKVNNGKEQYNWTTYSNLAAAYVKAGLKEKAESALKKVEAETRKMGQRCDRETFHYLISLYAGTSNLVEVYRIWKLLKSSFKVTTNTSTLIMVQSLARLGDIDGFKKIFQEWELTCSSYDLRLAKTAILLYVKHGLISEAEDVFDNILKRCKGPFYQHCKPLILYYLDKNQVDLALRCLEAAMSEVKDNEWHQIYEDVNRFVMEYFQKQRDVNGAEKCCKILKRVKPLDSEAYKLLLGTYAAASKVAPEMRRRIMDDGIEISSELEELLGRVCPE